MIIDRTVLSHPLGAQNFMHMTKSDDIGFYFAFLQLVSGQGRRKLFRATLGYLADAVKEESKPLSYLRRLGLWINPVHCRK